MQYCAKNFVIIYNRYMNNIQKESLRMRTLSSSCVCPFWLKRSNESEIASSSISRDDDDDLRRRSRHDDDVSSFVGKKIDNKN